MSPKPHTAASTPPAPRAWAPYLVATCAMLFAVLAWAHVRQASRDNDELRAQNEAQQVLGAINDRLNAQIGLLQACAGLFAASDEVTRDEFRRMIDRVSLSSSYPGTVGIGYTMRVEAAAQADLVERMRRDLPDFQIWPTPAAGAPAVDAHCIVYLEPLNEVNQLAIGYNMMTEPVRRAAMEAARDGGEAVASGRVTLVQDAGRADGGSPGFLIYVPVYRDGSVPATLEQRREQLVGFVYSPMHADELLDGVMHDDTGRLLDLTAADGEQMSLGSILYDSRAMRLKAAGAAEGDEPPPTMRLKREIKVAGRPWAIELATRPAFDRTSERNLPLYILVVGLVISALLLAVSLAQRRAARNAERIAQQVRQSQASLRESEQRFRATFNQAAAGMAQIDVDGRFLSVNQRLCDITGYSDDELLGMTFIEITHPDDRAVELEHMRQMAEGRIDMFSLEKRYIRRDGRVVWVNLSRSAVRDADGRMRYCIGVIEDVTERRRAEHELQEHRDHLESLVAERTAELEESHQRLRQTERIAALGTLSTGLGHDMGNLLLPIRLRLAAMQSKGLPPQFNDDVDAIRKSSEYLQQLANGLRLLALNPEDERASGQVNDLSAWWADAQPLLRNALPRSVKLESDWPKPAPGARIAAHLLTQVVFNLVQNAGEAMRSTGMAERGCVRVWATHNPVAATITLAVGDNGPGMTDEVRSRCMEPFFTTKTRGIATGMGLALVHGIVQRAGGSIDVESAQAEDDAGGASGTTFKITLPMVDASRGAAGGHALLGAAAGSHASAGGAARTSQHANDGISAGAEATKAQAVVSISDARRRAYLVSVLGSLGFDVRTDATPPVADSGLWVLEDHPHGEIAHNGDVARAIGEVPADVAAFVNGHAGRRAMLFADLGDAAASAPPGVVVLSPLAKPTAIWEAARGVARELSM